LENQIVTLEDLTYQYTDENILELLNNKIVEFQGEIEELQMTIDNAQVSFNNIAEETIVVVATRKEELAEIEKQQRFTDAKDTYEYLKNEISDYQSRL
jgi:esterase/lipase